MKYSNLAKRTAAGAMAGLMLASGMSQALAADQITPTCDEAYYATLDYYGGLKESSVVKTYRTYGNTSITDYGTYDKITNLTDSRTPSVSGGKVSFDLSGDVPDKLYFEGTSTQPFTDFPWTISMSYALNGVPTTAEELVGKTGVVDITFNAIPNENASEYSRNNLVLTAASVFNGDDIVSLEAPGAQVQLIGNLYCVLYAVLPGEEQHFTMRVGSDDFEYSGMIFLAVPATLSQLDQIAELKDAKEKLEDSYNAISDSMDVILNTLDGMSGSMSSAASGLDSLNQARGTISAGKGEVYDSLDEALASANDLSVSLEPAAGHLEQASAALDETVELLNRMSGNITGLSPEVENTRKLLKNMHADLDELQDLLDDLDDKDLTSKGSKLAVSLRSDLDKLGSSMDSMKKTARSMRTQLSGMESQLGQLEDSDNKYVTVNGMTVGEIEGYVRQANQLHAAYEASEYKDVLTFEQFIAAYLVQNGQSEQVAAAQAAKLASLYQQSQSDSFQQKLEQAKKVNKILKETDMSVTQLKNLVSKTNDYASPMLSQLENLCSALGSDNLSGDMADLCKLTSDAIDVLEAHNGAASSAIDTLKEASKLAERLTDNVDTALGQVEEMTGIMNKYQPGAQQAISDAKDLASSASQGVTSLTKAATSAENLAKQSGTQLDKGTQQTLSSLADILRRSATGLGQTGTIRNAKDTVEALIEDEWDAHSGEVNNLLLMDGTAAPQSMTDERNTGVTSIQYIMRSQEITKDSVKTEDDEVHETEKTTFWQRVRNMFRDIWNSITGLFK